MTAQALALGQDCFNCLRWAGQHNKMTVYPTCYHCEVCGNTLPTMSERRMNGRRSGIADNLRIGGFSLLLLATVIFTMLPIGPDSELISLMFLAGFTFYFLQIFQRTREILQDG